MSVSSLQVINDWQGQRVHDEVMEGADLGLALAAMEIVEIDKATTAFQSGALRNSKRTMFPAYSQDDTAASKQADLAEDSEEAVARQVINHEIKVGSMSNYAYKVERRHPSTVPAVDRVFPNMDGYIAEGISRKQRSI